MTSLQISPQEAAKELLARRRARESILDFTRYTMPNFEPGDHHLQICDALDRVEKGECKRLMIFAPPRHTKSELASRRFPALYLGKNPDKQIITATYSHDLASDFGRDVRNIVDSDTYRNLFDLNLRADSKSANRWHTDSDGVYISTGVEGPLTGRGAHVGLIDDPFKNRADADSEAKRDSVWDWYTSTFYTRLMPGGAIVIILTRWHEDDLAGRLLAEQEKGGDQWEVVSFKAIENEDTPNERALWPAWYPLETLKQTKRVIGNRDWGSLYQQEPKPQEGTFFKREWFNRFTLGEQPPNLNNYISSDYAVSGDDGDFTELACIGIDSDVGLWFQDYWYGQKTADLWINQLINLVDKWKPLCSFGESGVIKKALEPFIKKQQQARGVYFRQEWITRTSNKTAMSVAFQGMAAAGKVNIPHTDWGDRLINQLCDFPSGKYDDAVDLCALIGLALNMQHGAIIPAKDNKPRERDPWGREIRESNSWRTQ